LFVGEVCVNSRVELEQQAGIHRAGMERPMMCKRATRIWRVMEGSDAWGPTTFCKGADSWRLGSLSYQRLRMVNLLPSRVRFERHYAFRRSRKRAVEVTLHEQKQHLGWEERRSAEFGGAMFRVEE
jgi:hypothetical protein